MANDVKTTQVKATATSTTTKVATPVAKAAPAAKAVEKKVEPKKAATPAKKAPAKKAPAKKAATAKKTTATKAESKASVIVQFQNNEVNVATIEERVKAQFVAEGHAASSIKKVAIYVKPEEFSAYYVINEKFSGRVDLF